MLLLVIERERTTMKQGLLNDAYEHYIRKEEYSLPIEAGEKVYNRKFCPPERVILFGGGHVAVPTCAFLSTVGFEVTVVEDRPDFVTRERFPQAVDLICRDMVEAAGSLGITGHDYIVLMTREHRLDYNLLCCLLKGEFPRYLGMLGSKKRVGLMFERLEHEGYDKERLKAIHSPIGLDIGALSVEEIALSVAAELVRERRKKAGSSEKMAKLHVASSQLQVTDIREDVLKFGAYHRESFVMMTLCETLGSTPAKSGSIMFLDAKGRTSGTIGGGPAEDAALKKAKAFIGSGKKECFIVDMNGKTDENGLMLCGGKTLILIEDVELSI